MTSNFQKVYSKLALATVLLGTLLPTVTVNAATNAPSAVVTLDGSTTVYPVAIAAVYQFNTNGNSSNIIGYTGSGHGQTSIGNGYVDVGMSSSNCSATNMKVPNPAGFTTAAYNLTGQPNSPAQCNNLVDNQIGLDALTIISHPSKASCFGSGALTLTVTQQIWEGVITTWNDARLGGSGANCTGTIKPRARILTSGTRASFQALAKVCATSASGGTCVAGGVVEETVIANTGLPREQGNAQMLFDIVNNPDQIGYTSLAFVQGAFSAKLDCRGWIANCNAAAPLVDATDTNAKNGTYPMTRALHMYTGASPNAATTDYINFMKGPFGQSLVDQSGYVALFAFLPNWDIEGNGCADIGDISKISAAWQQSGPVDPFDPDFPNVRGWVRADVNFDGIVDIGDVSAFGAKWQQGC